MPESLVQNGIVPAEWEMLQPVRTPQASLVRYQNGVTIVAHPNKVVFAQSLTTETAIETPQVAQRYAQTMPDVNYQGVGIYVRAYVPFPGENQHAAREYLCRNVLAKGTWEGVGTAPVEASLNLKYTLEHSYLELSIQEAALQLPGQQRCPIVLFVGNFSHPLSGQSSTEKLQSLTQIVAQWQNDVEQFKSLVSEKFLGAGNSTLPNLFATAR